MHGFDFLDFTPHGGSASSLGMEHTTAILIAPAIHTDAERIAALEQQVAEAKSSADNSWMLMSSALVLLMTGPGLALFYGGLVRKKNVLATMMQSFAMMCLVTDHVGPIWVQPGIRFGEQFYRWIRALVSARCGRRSEPRLRGRRSRTRHS